MKNLLFILLTATLTFSSFAMNKVTLKDGSQVSETTSNEVYKALNQLMQGMQKNDMGSVLALYDINEKAKNPAYDISFSKDLLSSLKLIDSNDSVPSEIALIIRNALLTQGEGFETSFRLVSPVSSTNIPTVNVKLPSQKELFKRLAEVGFDHFLEKTRLHSKLGDQNVNVNQLLSIIDQAISDYAKYVNNPMITRLIAMRKPEIVELLLQDNPEAQISAKQILEEN